jgi:ectoine hydroxylase-related dioxygenase (phytanoyl-CoA dioxygenase family)
VLATNRFYSTEVRIGRRKEAGNHTSISIAIPTMYKKGIHLIFVTNGVHRYHVDQNAYRPGRKGKVCVQGLVTLLAANEHTGGLTVIPGSHRHHTEMCERSSMAKHIGDFIPIDNQDPLLENGALLLCAEAGDLIVWDSR